MEKLSHLRTSLKFKSVNVACYISKTGVQKSESSKLPWCILIQPCTNALHSKTSECLLIQLSQDFKVK